MTENPYEALTNKLAEQLGEKEPVPIKQIENIIRHFGEEYAILMADAAVAVEESGGMLTADGSRKRTIGGVFFWYVRFSLPTKDRQLIWPDPIRDKVKKRREQSGFRVFDYERRDKLKPWLEKKEKGQLEAVNIVLKGRPKHVQKFQQVYILSLEYVFSEQDNAPPGVPLPENGTTQLFHAYVDEEMWFKHVGHKLDKDTEALLSIDGFCSYDPVLEGIAVYARGVKFIPSSDLKKKKEDRERKRIEKRESLRNDDPAKAADMDQKDEDEEKLAKFTEEVSAKLRPLYGARRMFRRRLEQIRAKPEAEQSGLQAMEMALDRTEKQIALLEAQSE